MVRNFVAAALCMAIVACAAGARKTAAPSATPSTDAATAAGAPHSAGDTGVMPGDPRAEIEQAWNAIETESKEMGLTPAAEPAAGTAPAAQPMSTKLSTDATCTHGNSDACTDSCRLSDSICKNAEKICKLATQLAPDPWAAGKCTQATQTCDSAHDTCCSCK